MQVADVWLWCRLSCDTFSCFKYTLITQQQSLDWFINNLSNRDKKIGIWKENGYNNWYWRTPVPTFRLCWSPLITLSASWFTVFLDPSFFSLLHSKRFYLLWKIDGKDRIEDKWVPLVLLLYCCSLKWTGCGFQFAMYLRSFTAKLCRLLLSFKGKSFPCMDMYVWICAFNQASQQWTMDFLHFFIPPNNVSSLNTFFGASCSRLFFLRSITIVVSYLPTLLPPHSNICFFAQWSFCCLFWRQAAAPFWTLLVLQCDLGRVTIRAFAWI